MNPSLIDHQYVYEQPASLPARPAGMYQYITASNGIFVRAERPGMRALIMVGEAWQTIRGLASMAPKLWIYRRAPLVFLKTILNFSIDALPNEMLFYLVPANNSHGWALVIPAQKQDPVSVSPVDPFHLRYQQALIEVHSHGHMSAFFSKTDNQDETGFRIYAVLGQLEKRPTLAVRIGIYGHFMDIPASWVFELPDEIADASAPAVMEDDDDHDDDPGL